MDGDPQLTTSPRWARAVAAVAAGVVGLFVAWPAWHVLRRGVGPGVLGEVAGDPRIARIVGQTILQAAASTVLAIASASRWAWSWAPGMSRAAG